MIAEQAAVDTSELWYVAMAPGETKLLTLEQLDDLFRLDIIDASTRVWQAGMPEWLPLSVVAGLEAPAPAANRPPPPSARRPVAPPPPPQRTQLHAVPSPAPAPARAPQQRPTAYAQTVPAAASAWPPVAVAPAATSAWPPVAVAAAPGYAAPAAAPVESFRPTAFSTRPMVPPKSGGAAGRVVLVMALLAGVGVTLYRNDVIRQAAASAGQESKYLELEHALGGPGFGTPRAIQQLTKDASNSVAAALAAAPVSTFSTSTSARTAAASTPTTTSSSTTSSPTNHESAPSATTTPRNEPPAAETQPAPATKSPPSPSRTTSSSVASKATTAEPRHAAPRSEARSAPARSNSRSEGSQAEPSGKGLGFKGSSNAYDPLNGKL